MESTITFERQQGRQSSKSLAGELLSKKEFLKKKVQDHNLQLKNLLQTNFELLKSNDIDGMLFF